MVALNFEEVYPELKTSPINKRYKASSSPMWSHIVKMTADWELRNNSDSSEWKLCPQSFQRICQLRETPEIDLFASRLSHKIKTYFLGRSDPFSQEADAFQQNWFHKTVYAFLPFCMISKVLSKIGKDKVPMTNLVTTAWPSQLWCPEAMRMSMQ